MIKSGILLICFRVSFRYPFYYNVFMVNIPYGQ